jgi:hypothetical protein
MADNLFDGTDTVEGLTSQMSRLDAITTQFGRSLSRALSGGIAQGRGFDDILRGLGQRLIDISLRAAFKPLETGISGLLGGLANGVTGLFGGAGFGSSSLVTGLFDGGSTGSSFFGASGNAPARSAGVTVNMAITTPDAESFRRSEAQVGAALARAVARGQRSL